jgi:hypothetical protein
MKHLKALGLAAIAAGALMAFVGAGTASATELTCTEPAGVVVMCKAPTHIHAEVEGKVLLHPPIGDIECTEGTFTGRASTGSSTETVKSVNAEGKEAEIETLTFGKCNAEVVVLKKGSLEIHTTEEKFNHDGTLTSTGAEVTVTFSGFHCIFSTKNTDIGWLTGSTTAAALRKEETGTPTLDIKAKIPRTGGRSGAFCGTEAEWTGNYKITTPDWMDVL